MRDAKHIVAPKYRELSVAKLWPFIKELPELNQYFPTLKEDELPERDYMWTIISTVNSEATSKLIKDARKGRMSEDAIDQDQLVEVDPALFKEIKEIVAHKGNRVFLEAYGFYVNIVHRGRVPYMLKKSAKLHRSRKPVKNYDVNYGQFSSRQSEGSKGRGRGAHWGSGRLGIPTVEMEDGREEIKENISAQRSIVARHDERSNK